MFVKSITELGSDVFSASSGRSRSGSPRLTSPASSPVDNFPNTAYTHIHTQTQHGGAAIPGTREAQAW